MNKYLISSMLVMVFFVSVGDSTAEAAGRFSNEEIREMIAAKQSAMQKQSQVQMPAQQFGFGKQNQLQHQLVQEQKNVKDKDEQIQKLMKQLTQEEQNSHAKDDQIQKLTQNVQDKNVQIHQLQHQLVQEQQNVKD